MSGQSDAVTDQLLHDAVTHWPERSDLSPANGDEAERFLRLYYRHVAPEELTERAPAEVCGAAMAHCQLAGYRPPGRARVRVYTPTQAEHGWDVGHSVVEIVTDDAPFLVNSVTMELNRQGIGVQLVIHPQLRVERDLTGRLVQIEPESYTLKPLAESWMHIEIDRQSDAAVLKRLEADLERVLADVRHVDEDAAKMRHRAAALADEVAASTAALQRGGVEERELRESVEFLRWAADRHFTFMGYREYRLVTDEEGNEGLRPQAGSGLGLLRLDGSMSSSFAALPPEARAKAREPHVLVLTKANSRATVHRPRYLDYIGVKKFDEQGNVVGERRFLGLFTYEADTASIAQIPILRRKLAEVLDLAGFDEDSYDGKDLVEILEGFPREELFQTSVPELYDIVLGVLRLRERRGSKLFLRRDVYGRYMSCLVYMPRDRFNTNVRLEIQQVLDRAFQGATMDHSVMVGSAPLARLHIVVRARRGQALPEVDHARLEAEVVEASRSWDDDLVAELTERFGPDRATELLHRYGQALPEGYKADTDAATAVLDISRLDALGPDDLTVNLYKPARSLGDLRFKVYRSGEPISLSRVLPLLEHMGVEVVDERPYRVAQGPLWVYDFGLAPVQTADLPAARLKELFEDAFVALWHGRGESDRFNALVLRGGMTWRELTILRAYAKYLRQTGSTFTPAYIADVLVANVHLANLLVRLFESRFDPRLGTGREERTEAIAEEIRGELDLVASLDHDRILRAFLALIEGTMRTNFFQRDPESAEPDAGKPYLVYKLDPENIPDLPAPRPKREMFVYSPRMEGVHLRFGAVARGGLRWSDRPEDFRTEVLGLVKAQMVKNAVIVPTGAKGGFVCKQLPVGADRDVVQAEVVACYQQFISGLLDVTDNLVNGDIEHPADVVRYDGDDSYLVVAADKGTATFSDIANRIAADRGFWLGDAFASGGSVGYDHKAMGITARGAWESVRFHFREMGVDVQNEDFTVVGIGDMSGDVFGNGMLLSPHIRLLAAFDHRHIFLDPDPDPKTSFAERRRMFELPRSSWADYDPALISAGGGVHPRTAKSIPITPQVRAALGIDDGVTSLTPFELIRCVLRAPADLLWNGGIGTYVKASGETNAAVGDKTNDPVRIDATELRAKVVGEGGNLGLTQLARIEFALAGGRVNTDFIDNSAGVDTSDHEVNIKILLDRETRAGRLTREERDELFLSMTDEVARLVLRNNDDQNVALAAARTQASSMLHVHARYIRRLERAKKLKRKLEFLPDDKTVAARRSSGQGLTGPEFATLLSYAKITLGEEILASDLPNDPYLRTTLTEYFPTALRERFTDAMPQHPLSREIVTTQVVNDMVNRSGSTFAFRMNEETGAGADDIARAYLVVREVFGMPDFWQAVEELDHQVDVDTQLKMLLEGRKLTERAARWLLRNRSAPFDLGQEIAFFREGVPAIVPQLPTLLRGGDLEAFSERRSLYVARGVPEELAERVAGMVPAYSTFDLVDVAHQTGRAIREVAEVYFHLADELQISRLRERIIALPRDDRWSTMARSAVRDDLYAAHAELARNVLVSGRPGEGPGELRAHWIEQNESAVRRARQTLSEIWESERFDLATLSVALRAIRSLVTSSS
ncbi:NAD-glutamate dehydrogenase [Marinitenerispora sediminis]|uniref:NAD-glutamate dehydrogenase n=1 Tax=Marinitenerispora sediminis TaxID=1931232 RepID=A0A368TAW9_9ACTN|nr:NAD-glutamate dehydrogenase [Marinitenerispora sediminis]RCV55916.1 NAD-glutamate dehydrogenase [Marinitenerispora sediminis]RCV61960.1 NAD-glutamate dehydrogenase [Marinitenerispora sediminis]RCV62046.1 NAD-glutamate dehydrogenase [Marinitenerispora sediminis]